MRKKYKKCVVKTLPCSIFFPFHSAVVEKRCKYQTILIVGSCLFSTMDTNIFMCSEMTELIGDLTRVIVIWEKLTILKAVNSGMSLGGKGLLYNQLVPVQDNRVANQLLSVRGSAHPEVGNSRPKELVFHIPAPYSWLVTWIRCVQPFRSWQIRVCLKTIRIVAHNAQTWPIWPVYQCITGPHRDIQQYTDSHSWGTLNYPSNNVSGLEEEVGEKTCTEQDSKLEVKPGFCCCDARVLTIDPSKWPQTSPRTARTSMTVIVVKMQLVLPKDSNFDTKNSHPQNKQSICIWLNSFSLPFL